MGWVALAGLAVSALAQYGQANAKARDEKYDATVAQADAKAHAELIRRAAKAQRAAAQAAYVGGGVDSGTGSALMISESITRDSELDAYNAILTGTRQARSLRSQASQTRAQGAINAGATVLSGAAGPNSGWKRSPMTYQAYGGTGYAGADLNTGMRMDA